jgi:hypothetical protein
MNKLELADVLADPEIQRHTERVLALREEERQTREKMGSLIAALPDEIAATLTPDTLLTDPRIGRQTVLRERSLLPTPRNSLALHRSPTPWLTMGVTSGGALLGYGRSTALGRGDTV